MAFFDDATLVEIDHPVRGFASEPDFVGDRDNGDAGARDVDHQVDDALREFGVDRRRRLVVLTPEGEVARDALLRRRRGRAEALVTRMLDSTGLGSGQLEWFLDALRQALAREE